MKVSGSLLERGVQVPSLKRELKWDFEATAKVGDVVEEGDILGTVKETPVVTQKIMVPYGVKGEVTGIKSGNYFVTDVVATIKTEKGEQKITLMQKWPPLDIPTIEKDPQA